MRNYVQPGDVLTFTAPVGGVVSGMLYKILGFLVVAAFDAAAGAEFEGQLVGVFTLPKATGQAWAEGTPLYWDDTAKKVTSTASTHKLLGAATIPALSADTTGRVRLNGIAVA